MRLFLLAEAVGVVAQLWGGRLSYSPRQARGGTGCSVAFDPDAAATAGPTALGVGVEGDRTGRAGGGTSGSDGAGSAGDAGRSDCPLASAVPAPIAAGAGSCGPGSASLMSELGTRTIAMMPPYGERRRCTLTSWRCASFATT